MFIYTRQSKKNLTGYKVDLNLCICVCVCVPRPSLDRNMYRYAYICLYTHKHILYYDGDPELLKTKQSEYESLLLSEELEWPRRRVSLQ